MRLRLTLAVLFLASIPAFSQPFTLVLTGGTVKFGAAPMHITVSPNGGGTNGNLAPAIPPATIACKPAEAVTLTGSAPIVIHGTMIGALNHPWDVEFVFPGPPFANQGNLSSSSTNWELTGKYRMTIKDTVTNAVCTKVVGASGEYQFAGAKLSGWPHDCAKPTPTNSPGQSPGLTGSIILGGHAGIFPLFVAGGTCSNALKTAANTRIVNKGFDAAQLDYKLTY